MPATGNFLIRRGPHSIVVVASIRAVDCHQRQVSQVGALAQRHRARRLSFRQRLSVEFDWDFVTVNSNLAIGLWVGYRSYAFDDLRLPGGAVSALHIFDDDDIAVLGALAVLHSNADVTLPATCCQLDSAISAAALEYTDDHVWPFAQ